MDTTVGSNVSPSMRTTAPLPEKSDGQYTTVRKIASGEPAALAATALAAETTAAVATRIIMMVAVRRVAKTL